MHPKLFLLLFAFFNCTVIYAQQRLSQSRHTSPYTYVYALSDKETIELYRDKYHYTGDKYLHTLKDSFPTGKDIPSRIPPGNYLKVYVKENTLQIDPLIISNLICKLVNNNKDLVVVLHTPQGELIKDASVQTGKHPLTYDEATQSWRLNNYDKKGFLQIHYKGLLTCMAMEHQPQPNFWKKSWYKIKRVSRLWHRKNYRRNNNYYYTNRATNRGFIAFSKPIYKPLDTIKVKGFIVDKKGSPINSKLLLRLRVSGNDPDIDTILTTISPYRPGAYEYQFVLTDSLDIDLDDDYIISLETTDSKGKELEDRHILMEGKITYEEYELHSITFSARTDKKEHTRHEPVALYVKATDENDLPVMDGKISIVIKTGAISNYYAPKLFIPDTLWQYSQPMDALGETKILIPDSIFPQASLSYNIECEFLNSNNESRSATIRQEYRYDTKGFKFKLINDSLHLTFTDAGNPVQHSAWLYALNSKEDTVQATKLQLPATIKVNPFATEYELDNDTLYETYELKDEKPDVQNISTRTRDSIHIQISNPRNLYFWYTIFAGKKVVQRGYGNSLQWNAATITDKHYFLAIQYIWADKVHKENSMIPYMEKSLAVDIIAPANIYPGQHAHIGIAVTDANNEPVADADVTAYAFTSKFESPNIPQIPYLGRYYPGRKGIYEYSEKQSKIADLYRQLNWEKWRREMGLDSIRYFQFRHPDPIFRYYEPAGDSITQVAPFVMGKGNFIPVHVIYINELPVYFSQADQLQPYSFAIHPGWNKIALRTPYQQITFDSVLIREGVKNFLSIDTSGTAENVSITRRPFILTDHEVTNLGNYMISVENIYDYPAYIEQNDRYYWINAESKNRYNYRNNGLLTGPLTGANATLIVKDNFDQPFVPESGYTFNIQKGLIKQRQPYPANLFSNILGVGQAEETLSGEALTEAAIDSILTEKQHSTLRTNNLSAYISNGNQYEGRLNIHLQNDTLSWRKDILQFFLFRYDDPQYIRALAGNTTSFGKLESGSYKLLILFTNNRYFITDSIHIKDNGINYYNISTFPLQQNSEMITELMAELKTAAYARRSNEPAEKIAETFNRAQMSTASLTRSISGIIQDNKGQPLPYVSVVLKGTSFGTITDKKGVFFLNVTSKGILHVAYIGYSSKDIKITEANNYNVTLFEHTAALQEVVVIGYGTTTKRYSTGSISTISAYDLSGKVAGVQIRGQNSPGVNQQPLIIVDGLPFNGNMGDINPATIKSVKVLKDAEATALYGAAGSAGVIIITTGNAAASADAATPDQPAPGNTLRKNFRDDAFWQPRLRTDASGKTSFDVTFPDDITNWRTFIIAMTGHKQSGIAETKIRSFKALSANLGLPNFAVEGDTINVIGKMLNYMPDSITVTRTFTVNDSIYKSGPKSFKNAGIDTMPVYIRLADSVAFKYTALKDGYFDGEERKIPVIEQGTTETAGFFAALYKDTSFTYTPSHTEPVKIYASSAILPILEEEIKHVQRYEYLCNEQLASKLKAFLLEKKIHPDFKGEKDIKELINRLNNGRKDALWGWWENTPISIWVSRHVIEALLMADEMGYTTNMNKQIPLDYLVYQLNSGKERDSIGCMLLLSQLNAKIDYKSYIDSFKAHTKVSAYENLRIAVLQQRTGLPVNLQSVLSGQQHTLFGNPYWGEDSYRLSDNSIQHTLMVYKILRKQGGYEDLLQKIRGYFLEQRKDGYWRNTYESSLILETILPDVMEEQQAGAPKLTINGKTITNFPYATELNAPVSVSKKGKLPVYFTAYQQYHNRQPEKLSKPFTVTSSFNKQKLKAGEPVTLTVDVDVNESGDYVMVEIPIPAGCSYNDKPQSWYNNEVHREYFKHKVSIFCSSLTKGKHTFTISLLPRYTGSYYLNPAKVELQYFPVFMGREGLKKVDIR
jgi:TonB-dependent SusC/RagA subfamily outer membrane receptor